MGRSCSAADTTGTGASLSGSNGRPSSEISIVIGLGFRGHDKLDLVNAIVMSVVDNVETQLLERQVHSEDQIGGPALLLADLFHRSRDALQLPWIGLDLEEVSRAQLSGCLRCRVRHVRSSDCGVSPAKEDTASKIARLAS